MRIVIGLGIAVAVVACSKATKPEKTPPPEAARPAPTTPPPPFILASAGGVFALDATGATTRQYTDTPAAAPRFVPGSDDVLFFHAPDRAVYRLSLATGEQARVATVPEPAACGTDLGLSIQAEWDFVVDASGARACLRLLDRNENMAEVGVTARIDLATGAVDSGVSLGFNCPEDEAAADLFDCRSAPAAPAPTHPPVDPAKIPAGFEVETRSPSGRWAVIAGNTSEGDYIHRDALLLDTTTGAVYPVAEGPWPDPLERAAVEAFEYETADVVGESTIEWLRADTDLLRIDRLLVTPGNAVVAVDGDLAQRPVR